MKSMLLDVVRCSIPSPPSRPVTFVSIQGEIQRLQFAPTYSSPAGQCPNEGDSL